MKGEGSRVAALPGVAVRRVCGAFGDLCPARWGDAGTGQSGCAGQGAPGSGGHGPWAPELQGPSGVQKA